MPTALLRSPSHSPDRSGTRMRILHQARRDFFVTGYSRFTMDGLAAELGMSKKTLYVHFAGKDEIVGAIIDHLAMEIRADADAQQRIRIGPDFHGEMIDDRSHNLVLPGEMHVERLLGHPELRRQRVHRET